MCIKIGCGFHHIKKMGKRFGKWRRMVREMRAKFYIIRVCVTMLLCWDKYS
ncbi:small polypeptide DEVIL 5-like [Salvia hispanica]|uniref:small polypeptide DEVIL 5-like n=1 Tax=Salvia hispanica TaxID=49212 RepID=UPI002009C642|nr:small polypeptide DEVIL 5-like [Salvia hispanica]